MRRRSWAELSASQRRLVIAGTLVQAALQVAALRDLRRRAPDQVNGPRWMWAGATMVNFAGPIAYFLFGRRRPGGA